MRMRDRTLVPAALPALAPLPSLPSAFSRRAALFGSMAATGFLAAAEAAVANGEVITTLPSAVEPADAHLVALVDELQTGMLALNTLANSDPRDCDEIPGYPALEGRLHAIVAELYRVRAQSIAGVLAHARALQVPFVADDYQTNGDLAWNLADDLIRLHFAGALND